MEWGPKGGSTLVGSRLTCKIRLEENRIELPNTLDYYDTATIVTVKRFTVQAPGGRIRQLMYPIYRAWCCHLADNGASWLVALVRSPIKV